MSQSSQFISTRGEAPEARFAEVLLAGLAPDGGLYMPAAWPQFSAAEIAGFAGKRYQDVAFEILFRFVGDSFTAAELRDDIEAAYAGFERPEIAPLSAMSGNRYLLELFHGPTFASRTSRCRYWGGCSPGRWRVAAAGPPSWRRLRAIPARRPDRRSGRACQYRSVCVAPQGPGSAKCSAAR